MRKICDHVLEKIEEEAAASTTGASVSGGGSTSGSVSEVPAEERVKLY